MAELDLGPLGDAPPARNGAAALEPAPPQNVEAEELVLGALLFAGGTGAPGVADNVAAAGLLSSHFYRESHGLIYTAVRDLHGRHEPFDAVSVVAELERTGRARYVAQKGGTAQGRVHELAAIAPAVGNAPHWARLVMRSWAQRTGQPLEDSIAPVFLDVHEFVAQQVEVPAPLWGTPKLALIPAAGLVLFAGRPGVGKTTFLLDLACHLAAGIAYPPQADDKAPEPYPVPRPLRVAVIENEGPQEMFRDKVAQKLRIFGASRIPEGNLLIQTWRWGAFSFADEDAHARARTELDAHDIDIVVGDPLGMLGVEGVGSPADTRAFVQLLRSLGLGTSRAFMFLHHFRERAERTEDEMARISGAWGGHLDTLITLAAMGDAKQARMAFPKVRWARAEVPDPIILGRVINTAAFEALRTEGDLSLLEPLIAEYLTDLRARAGGYGGKGWQTYAEIAKHIERRRQDVKRALEQAQHLFAERTGAEAKSLGAKSTARLWGLREWDDAPEPEPAGQAEPEPEHEQQEFPDPYAAGGLHDDIPF